MKKRILLFSSSIILFSGMIMSNNGGPITNGNGNRTGSKVTTTNCSSGGTCHATNTGTTLALAGLLDSNNAVVTTWEPGVTYKVQLTGSNATQSRYGFQVSVVHGTGVSQAQAGVFGTAPANTLVKPTTGLQIWEHTSAIPYTTTFTNVINWTAPIDTNIDTVKIYAIVNAVNGNGNVSGDAPNVAPMVAYARQTAASVATLNADIKIATYPNPVTDKLNISLENAGSGTYSIRVFDMNGKVVANQTANVNKSYSTSINAAAWANGMYHVQLQKDGAQRTIAVIKQ